MWNQEPTCQTQLSGPDANYPCEDCPSFHQRGSPSRELPWICKHLSEILVLASGLHGRGRKPANVCQMTLVPKKRPEYHMSQCLGVTARLFFLGRLSL